MTATSQIFSVPADTVSTLAFAGDEQPAPPPAAEAALPAVEAPLFELQLQFNLFPATYAHASWVSALGLETAPGADSPRPFWVRTLSDALLRMRGLERAFDVDFSDRAKRLALIDGQTLLRVGGLVSALLVRDRLRRIVHGPQVEALQRLVGVDGHRLAMNWPGELPHLPLPLHQLGDALPDTQTWALRGMMLLMSAMPKTSPAVFGRLQFKFPQHWARVRKIRLRLQGREQADLMRLFVAVITHECTQWRWLFDPTLSMRTHGGLPQ